MSFYKQLIKNKQFLVIPLLLSILLIVTCVDTNNNSFDKDQFVQHGISYKKNQSPVGSHTLLIPTFDSSYEAVNNKNFTIKPSGIGTASPGPKLPFIKSDTGEVGILPDTTAGTYIVTFNANGLTSPVTVMLYITTNPTDKFALNTVLETGINNFGKTADFNYIITSSITDMECFFSKNYSIDRNGNCTLSTATKRPFLDGFNGDISKWDVSQVTNMKSIFESASAFNGDISKWDVSQVTNMYFMFAGLTMFNGNISDWKVGAVTNMNSMFYNAKVFNQNLNNWDVRKVQDMSYMFNEANAFNQDLSGWNVGETVNKTNMFLNSGVINFPQWYTQ